VAMTLLSVMSAPSFAQKTPTGKGAGGLSIAAVDVPRVQPCKVRIESNGKACDDCGVTYTLQQPRHVLHVQIPLGGAGHEARRIGVPPVLRDNTEIMTRVAGCWQRTEVGLIIVSDLRRSPKTATVLRRDVVERPRGSRGEQ